MVKIFIEFYARTVLGYPKVCLSIAGLLILAVTFGVPRFQIDASGDSLLLESDEALEYYREIRERYGTDDFIIVVYEPKAELFSDSSLETLGQVVDQIEELDQVRSVNSILNVPLFESPPVSREDLEDGAPTLLSERTDRELARTELRTSPLYGDRLVGEDGKVSAIQVNLEKDSQQTELSNRQSALLSQRKTKGLSDSEESELEALRDQIDAARHDWNTRTSATIDSLEAIAEDHKDVADILIGGLPAINIYMLDYIRRDIVVFGIAMLSIIVVILSLIFAKPRWVFIPLGVAAATIVTMMGALGLADMAVTVVSSNFLALMLILTLSLTIHLAVRYRELRGEMPRASQRILVRRMVRTKFLPSVLTTLSTMVAFGSLVVSDIRPVIDFGWMMVAGLLVSFVLTFTILPPALMLLKTGQKASKNPLTDRITGVFSALIIRHPLKVLVFYLVIGAVSLVFVLQLSVDNRFVDYYRSSTEVYRGLEIIDTRLGGTTPFEVILDAPQEEPQQQDDEFDDFLALPGDAGFAVESHWYNTSGLETVARIHEFIESQPAVGSIQSLKTTEYVLDAITEGALDNFALSIAYKRMPDDVKATILEPFVSEDGDQARLSARAYETKPELDRSQLLNDIRSFVTDEVGIDSENVHITGLFVLYNNVLQSLLRSQLYTALTVIIAVMLMFLVSFRSLKVAVLATVPNILAASIVLAIMSIAGLPLDIMTITIAAVAVGIGVDDTIHYVHRYMSERPKQKTAEETIKRCHQSVGRAMYFTSLVIALGFSVFALSQFMPTIYFGLLTGTAMLVALIADLTLLPLLLAKFKAFEFSTKN